MSDSVWPHRQQPTKLPHPWNSPGKNTGVDCHFFLQCMKVKSESEDAQSYPTLSDPMDCSLPGSSVHGIFQARVLEWVAIAFSNVNLSPFLILWWMRAQSLQLCSTLWDTRDCNLPGSSIHRILQASILEWVAMPSFRGSSWSRDRTHVSYVSCIGRRVHYH